MGLLSDYKPSCGPPFQALLLVNRGAFFGHCEISQSLVDSSTGDHAELRPRAGAPLLASPQLVSVSDDGTDQFVSTSK